MSSQSLDEVMESSLHDPEYPLRQAYEDDMDEDGTSSRSSTSRSSRNSHDSDRLSDNRRTAHTELTSNDTTVLEDILTQTRLLVPARTGIIDLALLCVASPANVFHVMSSALMQRHALGVDQPLVTLVYDNYSTVMQLLVGWVALRHCEDDQCVSALTGNLFTFY